MTTFTPGVFSTYLGQTFGNLNTSLFVDTAAGGGLTISGNTYTVSEIPNVGLALFDNGSLTLGSPYPTETVSLTTLAAGDSTHQVVQYYTTLGDGSVSPATGGIGGQVIAYNATGVLFEQLSGYIPNGTITPDGSYFVVTEPSVDLSFNDPYNVGYQGPTAAELTFTVGGTAIPEPSMVLLMPIMVIGLIIARVPAVRSYLRSF